MQTYTLSKTFWVLSLSTLILVGYGATFLLGDKSQAPLINKQEINSVPLANLAAPADSSSARQLDVSEAETQLMPESLVNIGSMNTIEKAQPLPRLLSSYTQAGAKLDTFLEEKGIGYLDSSYYPFDAQTEALLRRYANSGKMLFFDNTEATENLLEFNKTSGDVVSDYYGTGSESAMTIATSIKLANGGIEYMVLPVSTSDQENEDLSERVKLAIELFELEQAKKQEANAKS